MSALKLPSMTSGLGAVVLIALLAPDLGGCKGCAGGDKSGTGAVTDTGTPADVPFTDDWGQWLTMAVMPDGRPAAAAYDRTQGALTFAIATLDSAGTPTWKHEEVDGYPDSDGLDVGDRGTYASMAINTDGTIWISFYDVKLHALRYAKGVEGGPWETGVADAGGGATPNAGLWTSLALDAKGDPVIAHYDAGKAELRVAHWGGTAFSGEVVDSGEDVTLDSGDTVSADVGKYARLKIANGEEYIAYYDAAAGALKLASGTSGAYSVEVVDNGGDANSDVGPWPDMLVDSQGTLSIAYQDVTNQDLLFATGTPGSWTTSIVDDGEYRGADAALFLNGSYPAIAYFDGRNNNIMLAQEAGTTWSSTTLGGDDAALGYHNEVISTGGAHYAGCYDYTNRDVWFHVLD